MAHKATTKKRTVTQEPPTKSELEFGKRERRLCRNPADMRAHARNARRSGETEIADLLEREAARWSRELEIDST